MRTRLWAAAGIGLFPLVAAGTVHLYVSPTGSLSGSGTISSPFKYLTQARDYIRGASINDDIVVHLRGGTYYVWDGGGGHSNFLQLSAQDSAPTGHRVWWTSHTGERAIIHGGKRITTWTQQETANGKTRWTSTVPWASGLTNAPVDLYCNNARLVRARFPNATYDDVAPVLDNSSFLEVQTANSAATTFTVDAAFPTPHPSFAGYGYTGVLQMVARREWVSYRQYVTGATITPGVSTSVTLNAPLGIPVTGGACDLLTVRGPDAGAGLPGDAVYFEGAIEFLNAAYEWYYYPATGQIWIILPQQPNPPTGENNPNTGATVIAPYSTALLTTDGTSGVTFQDIDFAFTNFPLPVPWGNGNQLCSPYISAPSTGWFGRGGGYSTYSTTTSEYPLKGAVQIDGGVDVRVQTCRIAHTGGSGLMFRGGSDHDAFSNEVFDTGGTGLYLGRKTVYGLDGAQPENCSIRDNYIHDFGQVYQDAIGLKIDLADTATIFYNEVAFGPYSALHIGTFGHDAAGGNSVYIAWNKLHDAMLALRDGGILHTIGYCPSSSVHDNSVFNVWEDPWYASAGINGRRGMMLDFAKGTGYVINNNVSFWAQGLAIPFKDMNCDGVPPNNSYQSTSYFDEPGLYGVSGGVCASPPYPQYPPNSAVYNNLGITTSQPMAGIRDGAGPRSTYATFLYSTFDPLIHPY